MVKLKFGEVVEIWLYIRLGVGELTLLNPFVGITEYSSRRIRMTSIIHYTCLFMGDGPSKVRLIP